MYYDTLRKDGIYRLGATQAKKTGCPIYPTQEELPWENEHGATILKEYCGLIPLNNQGTRVIIEEPIDELISDLRSGVFEKAIIETWFRAIEKKSLAVSIAYDSRINQLTLPSTFPIPQADIGKTRTWVLGKDFKQFHILPKSPEEDLKVKNFVASYTKGSSLPEELRGIAVVHNGMKICSIQMTGAPQEIQEGLSGYIEFDRELDHELRKGANQFPNHYDLKWRRRVPFAIKGYINQNLEEFGRIKLGLGVDQREIKKRRRTNAEDWAIKQLMKYAKDLDLFGGKGKWTPPKPDDKTPRHPKPIGISINNFAFPNPEIAPRVNYGDSFSNLQTTIHNNTSKGLDVYVTVQVMLGDKLILNILDRIESNLQKKTSFTFEQFDLSLSKKLYKEPGVYRLIASLFSSTGEKIDSVARKFWLEVDPPLRQPFLIEGLPEFPPPYDRRQWYTQGVINNSPIFYYNMGHPAYIQVEDDPDMQNEYIFDIVLDGAISFILNRPDTKDGRPDFHPLEVNKILGNDNKATPGEIPSKAYDEISGYISEIKWKVFQGG